MKTYHKEYYRPNDLWRVYGREEGEDSDLLAEVQTELLADVLIACRERCLSPEDIQEIPYCDNDAKIEVTLRDENGNCVEKLTHDPLAAGLRALRFLILQGSDPDENGRGSTPGSIHFRPMR